MQKIKLLLSILLIAGPVAALVVESRLPGEHFREDNPPRFGALMSFTSSAASAVFLHGREVAPQYTIAQELRRITKSLKVPHASLQKIGMLEGETRWLQYTFRKGEGGGFLYVTRRENWILYLLVFNLKYDRLSRELPYVDRYLRQLKITDAPKTKP
ncbi:MAG: hypothetical protein OHK0011_02530 [Turneriella sp.]